MEVKLFQVDSFAEKTFMGNPAAVCPLKEWLPDKLMQAIALENNLSETAFFVPEENYYRIRWFTPLAEVDLCGHATLASAYVLFNRLGFKGDTLTFQSRSGKLDVVKDGEWFRMNFPSQPGQVSELTEALKVCTDQEPTECLMSEDCMLVFNAESDVLALIPDFNMIEKCDGRGMIVTAPSEDVDFVVRFFAPKVGVPEDPVTGSAYTQLTPYWSNRLGKKHLTAKQVSSRGGVVICQDLGDRVAISGKAALYLEGVIQVHERDLFSKEQP